MVGVRKSEAGKKSKEEKVARGNLVKLLIEDVETFLDPRFRGDDARRLSLGLSGNDEILH